MSPPGSIPIYLFYMNLFSDSPPLSHDLFCNMGKHQFLLTEDLTNSFPLFLCTKKIRVRVKLPKADFEFVSSFENT